MSSGKKEKLVSKTELQLNSASPELVGEIAERNRKFCITGSLVSEGTQELSIPSSRKNQGKEESYVGPRKSTKQSVFSGREGKPKT